MVWWEGRGKGRCRRAAVTRRSAAGRLTTVGATGRTTAHQGPPAGPAATVPPAAARREQRQDHCHGGTEVAYSHRQSPFIPGRRPACPGVTVRGSGAVRRVQVLGAERDGKEWRTAAFSRFSQAVQPHPAPASAERKANDPRKEYAAPQSGSNRRGETGRDFPPSTGEVLAVLRAGQAAPCGRSGAVGQVKTGGKAVAVGASDSRREKDSRSGSWYFVFGVALHGRGGHHHQRKAGGR